MTPARAAALTLATSGFVAGVVQVVLIRELLLACLGNEITLGLMLAAWLLCGAAGALWASRSGSMAAGGDNAVRRAIKLSLAWAPALFIGLTFTRVYQSLAAYIPMRLADLADAHLGIPFVSGLIRVHLASQPGEVLGPIHLMLISFGATLLPAVIAGALFAVGLRVYEEAKQWDRACAGQAYALDGIGHLVGGVVLGAAAVTAMNPFAACAIALIILWLCVGLLAKAMGSGSTRLLAVGVFAAVVALAVSRPLDALTFAVRWRGHELLDHVSSVYGHIAAARHGEEGVVFYQNGVPTGLSPALPSVQELVQFTMLQHPDPKRVLLIGGGAMGGLVEVLKHNPDEVQYAEIDPAVLRFAGKWVTGADRQALADPRVTKLATDGRLIVKQASAGRRPPYDVIILLLPDPSTALLNRFYTDGWFHEASTSLSEGGVLGWDLSSSRHYFQPSLLMLNTSIFKAARTEFARYTLMLGDSTMAVVLGEERSALTEDADELQRRMLQRGVRADYFLAVVRDRLDTHSKRYLLTQLSRSTEIGPNRDLSPIGYYYDQAVWLGFYFPQAEELYVRLGRLRPANLWLPGAVLMVLLLIGGASARVRAFYVPLAIMATGALGMALELCLLFAFQSCLGYVYRLVGVVMGAFMVGLALGSMAAAGWARGCLEPRRNAWRLTATQLLMGLLALLLPVLLNWLASSHNVIGYYTVLATILFPLATAAIGFAVGVQFPLATTTSSDCADASQQSGGEQSRVAAGLYAADLLGASVGAATMGAVFIPVLGIAQTCIASAVVAAAMALLLALRAALTR